MEAQSPFPSNLRGNTMPSLHWVMCSAIPRRCAHPALLAAHQQQHRAAVGWPRARPLPNPWGSKHISKGVAKVGLCQEALSPTESLREEPCIFLPQRVWELSTLIPCLSQKHCSQHRAWCLIVTAKSRKKNLSLWEFEIWWYFHPLVCREITPSFTVFIQLSLGVTLENFSLTSAVPTG